MNKDMEINVEKYDLVFIKNEKDVVSLNYDFVAISPVSLVYEFNVGLSSKVIPNESSLEWSFDIQNKPIIKADCNIIDSYSLLIQQMILRLKTPIGELKDRPNFGSRLEELRHKIITPSLIEKIKTYCIEALEDLIPNINAEIKYNNSTYSRNVIIILRDGDLLLTRYKLEV